MAAGSLCTVEATVAGSKPDVRWRRLDKTTPDGGPVASWLTGELPAGGPDPLHNSQPQAFSGRIPKPDPPAVSDWGDALDCTPGRGRLYGS